MLESRGEKSFRVVAGAIAVGYALLCLLPMLLVVAVSVTDEEVINQHGYRLIPQELSGRGYSTIFRPGNRVINSYGVSIFVTVTGTISAVAITGMAGYTLANRYVKYRNALALFFFITMVFNPGIVPWYLVNSALGLRNNVLALIIPNLVFNPFNLFLVRNFMKGIPISLTESAKIDGAGDAFIAFRIIMPLSIPVLAAIALFYGLGYWNDWWNAIMLVEDADLYPLQFLLFKLQSEIRMLQMIEDMGGSATTTEVPAESFKMATVIVTIGPIVFLYPVLQRYFIKGLVIGAIKG